MTTATHQPTTLNVTELKERLKQVRREVETASDERQFCPTCNTSITIYFCAPCDAYVGCHPDTERPLGRLANAELRQAKMAAHAAFDRLWDRSYSPMSRSRAYQWLADQLGIPRADCHIGMFDVERCRLVVAICKFSQSDSR